MNSTDFTVAFQIGRGGPFWNPGSKKLLDIRTELSDYCENLFLNTRGSDGRFLPGRDWTLTTESGHIVVEGRDAIESETGRLDFDGDYDTKIVKWVSECDVNELKMVLDFVTDKDDLQAVLEMLYGYVDIEVLDDDDETLYYGNDRNEIIKAANSEDAYCVKCEDVELWNNVRDRISNLEYILKYFE